MTNSNDTSARQLAEHVLSGAIVPTEPFVLADDHEECERALGSLKFRIGELESQLQSALDMHTGAQAAATTLREERDSMQVANVALLSDLQGHMDTIRDLTEKREELQTLNDRQRERLNAGIETPDDVLNLQRERDAFRSEAAAAKLDRESLIEGVKTINERLLAEATRREWCSDFDLFCNELNQDLPYVVPRMGRPDQKIRASFYVVIPHGSADRVEGMVDAGLRESGLPVCSSFDYEIVED